MFNEILRYKNDIAELTTREYLDNGQRLGTHHQALTSLFRIYWSLGKAAIADIKPAHFPFSDLALTSGCNAKSKKGAVSLHVTTTPHLENSCLHTLYPSITYVIKSNMEGHHQKFPPQKCFLQATHLLLGVHPLQD